MTTATARKAPEETQLVSVDAIRTDGGTQSRCKLDLEAVQDLAEALKNGAKIPAVRVYDDGEHLWLADGFHRVAAAKVVELEEIEALVLPGGQRDAFLFCLGANSEHGVRRTSADKLRAVRMALEDEELSSKSDREIARICAVSHTMVSNRRRELEALATAASAPPAPAPASEPPKAPVVSLEKDIEDLVGAIQGLETELKAQPGEALDPDKVRKAFAYMVGAYIVPTERWKAAVDGAIAAGRVGGAKGMLYRRLPDAEARFAEAFGDEESDYDSNELCDTALLCQILASKKSPTPVAVARHSWCVERDMAPASTKAQERWQRTLEDGAREGLWTYDSHGSLVLTEKGGAAPAPELDLEEAMLALQRRLQARKAVPGHAAQMGTVRPELAHVLDRSLTDTEWREIVETGQKEGRWCHLGELVQTRLLGPIWIPAEPAPAPKDPTDVEDLENDPDPDSTEDELEEETDDEDLKEEEDDEPPPPPPPKAEKPRPSAMPPEDMPQGSRVPLFISGPWLEWNPQVSSGPQRSLDRLWALSELASMKGYTPVCPGLMACYGAYGDPSKLEKGSAERRAIEARALQCSTALAGHMAHAGGGLWILLPDDVSSVSPEVEAEKKAFGEACPTQSQPHSLSMTWRSWRAHFEKAGLLELWSSL